MLLTPGQTRALFLHALENRYAVLAVNADSPAAITDVLEAALSCNAPIMIETSLWQLTGRSFGGGDPILGLARYLAQIEVLANASRYAHLPIAFHTDHIKGPATRDILCAAIRGKASSISLDSSSMTEEENLMTAIHLADFASSVGRPLTLELEAGLDDGLTPLDVTDRIVGGFEEAEPGVLALWAPGCGTRHGLGEASFSAEHVAKHCERAEQIAGRPLGIALHGSSGLSSAELRDAVGAGVVKVNWSSESLLLRSQTARAYYEREGFRLEAGGDGFKEAAMDNGVQGFVGNVYIPVVAERIGLLGGFGRASIHSTT